MALSYEELASLRAPNQSGVDMKAVLQALGGAQVATPTTYSYGMRLEDAQREGQAGERAQAARQAALNDVRDTTLKQDQQAFASAMQAMNTHLGMRQQETSEARLGLEMQKFEFDKAHTLFQEHMAERALKIQEDAAAIERRHKTAMASHNEAAAASSLADARKKQLEIDRLKALSDTKFSVPGANGEAQEISLGDWLIAGGKPADLFNIAKGLPTNISATERMGMKQVELLMKRGLSADDAAMLVFALHPGKTFSQMAKAINTNLDNMKDRLGRANYGTKKNADGTETARTADDVRASMWPAMVDTYLKALSPEGRQVIKDWGFGSAASFGEEAPQSPISSIDMDALASKLAELYGGR